MLMGIIPNLGFLKLDTSGFMRLVLSTNCAVRHLIYSIYNVTYMSSKKHSNAAGQSSSGNASKGRMQLTSYLWKKIGMLWKNYGKAMEFLFWGSVRTLGLAIRRDVAINFSPFVPLIILMLASFCSGTECYKQLILVVQLIS